MIKITMKEALKSRGWKQDKMAEELCCSVSQVSKIKNGNILITRNFQEKFQSVFPGYVLVNDVINWKERYMALLEKYEILRRKFTEMESALVSAKDFFSKGGHNLFELAEACLLNGELIGKCNLRKFPLRRTRQRKKA